VRGPVFLDAARTVPDRAWFPHSPTALSAVLWLVPRGQFARASEVPLLTGVFYALPFPFHQPPFGDPTGRRRLVRGYYSLSGATGLARLFYHCERNPAALASSLVGSSTV